MYDIHTHLSSDKLINNVENIISNARLHKINKILEVACHKESCFIAKKLANKYNEVFYTVGIHPNDADFFDVDFIESFLKDKDKKLVAIGETGLDFYESNVSKKKQIKVFEEHIYLAQKYNLPLIIHNRNAGLLVLDILKSNNFEGKAVFHCFTGNWDEAKKIIDNNFFISFTGIVTFNKKAEDIQKVAKKIPIDKMMIETDCPYLAPQSIRGQINTPISVIEIANFIASLKNTTFEDIKYNTTKNADMFFNW